MTKQSTLFTFLLGLVLGSFAQQARPAKGPLFDDSIVSAVYVTMDPDSVNELLNYSNRFSNHHFKANFSFDNGTSIERVSNVGFRLRGNTSRSSQKKSFKISFNEFVPNQKFHGVEKLNINGEHNDPSISRAKLGFDFLDYLEVPASRTNHVRLYINDTYFGLYLNVEHIDEEFTKSRFSGKGNLYKCLYGANLYYLGSSAASYKEDYYEIKDPSTPSAYADLAHLIDVLNNTSAADFECEVEQVFNVNSYIKSLVMDVLVGNWDGPNYNKNNFYLYYNPSNQMFEYIPYDLDNTLGVDFIGLNWSNRNIYNWSKNGSHRPLYQKILSRPKYRSYYTYWMQKSLEEYFNPDSLDPKIDALRSQIRPYAVSDTIRSLDYGYNVVDFDNSFSFFGRDHVSYGIKDYISKRSASALSQLDAPTTVEPIVYWEANHVDYFNDSLELSINTSSQSGIKSVVVEYNWEAQSAIWYDTLRWNSELTSYQTQLKWHPTLASVAYRYHITDSANGQVYWPSCHSFLRVKSRTDKQLYINEIMAKNTVGLEDEFGETDDWIEIYHSGTMFDNMKGYYLTDDLDNPYKYALPTSTVGPESFKLFWADDEDDQGIFHLNFKLSKEGETIGLFDADGSLIDSMTYSDAVDDKSYGRVADGESQWVWFQDPTPYRSNHIEELNIEDILNSIQIYPNPTTGPVWLQTNGYQAITRILDSEGREVKAWNDSPHMDMYGLASGIYFAHIRIGQKLVIQKKVLLSH